MMQAPPPPARHWLAVALMLSVTGLVGACSSSGSSATTVQTVTVTPPSASTSSSPAGVPTPSAPAPNSSSPAPAGPAECATAALRVSVGHGGAAAGTAYYHIDFTNVSGATCFLLGYPGVSLVSAGSNAGSQIGADAKRDAVRPVKPITLAPGQEANALLGVVDAGNYSAATCQPVTAHWLKVFPPDRFSATYAMFTTQTCASTSVHTLLISAISAGA